MTSAAQRKRCIGQCFAFSDWSDRCLHLSDANSVCTERDAVERFIGQQGRSRATKLLLAGVVRAVRPAERQRRADIRRPRAAGECGSIVDVPAHLQQPALGAGAVLGLGGIVPGQRPQVALECWLPGHGDAGNRAAGAGRPRIHQRRELLRPGGHDDAAVRAGGWLGAAHGLCH